MYRDNSLIPSEAVRLLALGILATGPSSYGGLASEIRHFTGRIVGPSLDLVGTPLELLRVEGLIVGQDSGDDSPEDVTLAITEAGLDEMKRLLASNVRGQVSDLNKLIIALKMRFLPLLDPVEQGLQAELLVELCERELARMTDLRDHLEGDHGELLQWLALDIAQTSERLEWFTALRDRIAESRG